ncbi:MAG TPA: phosphotransferase [Patescibacteria group bacterium]|nr:phosphotransferase [Patescibacteria group bacterium]
MPEVFSFEVGSNGSKLTMERLRLAKNVSFGDIANLVEELQTLPIDTDIPIYRPNDYTRRAYVELRFLQREGLFVGFSDSEVDRVKQAYSRLLPSLGLYKTVFVHGDVQARHFATKASGLAIFDFDQAHFGSELEDWAFLSIRHPFLLRTISGYLQNKFGNNPEQLANLEPAFLLMQIDKVLHSYFSRTYQWRGKSFDMAAKIYGRGKLLSLVSRAKTIAH